MFQFLGVLRYFRSSICDGSEFAGDEFEALTYPAGPTQQTHSSTEHIYESVYGETDGQTTMGEMVSGTDKEGIW